MSSCLAAIPVDDVTFTGLPEGWGVDRFPCTRVGAIDCFREGNFDYPYALDQIDGIIDRMMVHPNMTDCMTELQNNFATVLEDIAGMDAATAGGTAAYLAAPGTGLIFTNGIQGFWTYGYRWRPSYKTMTSEQILDHYTKAMVNSEDPDVGIVQCIMQSATIPCCVNWAAKKIPADIFLGAPVFEGEGAEKKITSLGSIRIVSSPPFAGLSYGFPPDTLRYKF